MTTRLDPAPFYRAALTDTSLADQLLDQHPIDHRFGLVFNAAIRTLQQCTQPDPDDESRTRMLEVLCNDWGTDLRDVFDLIITVAFDPDNPTLSSRISGMDRQDLGQGALCLPASVSKRLHWTPATFEALIDQLCAFDHTFGQPWPGGQL